MKRLWSIAAVILLWPLFVAVSAWGEKTRSADGPTVDKENALAAIGRMKATLNATKKTINDKYDLKFVTGTLEEVFRANGVQGPAMKYASAWGPNAVFVAYDEIGPFFKYHLSQLELSEKRISDSPNGSVRQADLQRLTQGMAEWEEWGKRALTLMDQMAGHYGKRAAVLEHKIEASKKWISAPSKEKAYWYRQTRTLDAIANEHSKRASDVRRLELSPIAKLRLFTSIYPVDSTEPCTAPSAAKLTLKPIPPFTGDRPQ